jgi:hypothetical protein
MNIYCVKGVAAYHEFLCACVQYVLLLSALRYVEQGGVVAVTVFVYFSTDKIVTLTVILQFL